MKIPNVVTQAKQSAPGLVNLLHDRFPSFRDEAKFERKTVQFLKRAQILVADLWAAFRGEQLGQFDDIDKLTMFAGKLIAPFRDEAHHCRLSSAANPQVLGSSQLRASH
jgi:Potential Queuosine, Q, salvage protein family